MAAIAWLMVRQRLIFLLTISTNSQSHYAAKYSTTSEAGDLLHILQEIEFPLLRALQIH